MNNRLHDKSSRLAWLNAEFRNALKNGELPTRSEEVNNHVHSCYSFSPYNPSMIAYRAWQAGLQAVGIMDHDSFAGAAELVEACKILGLGSTCGIELRVNAEGTGMNGRSLNNPGSSGIFYMAIHGIPLREHERVADFLKPIQAARNERNRRQVEKLNGIISSYGVSAIDFENDVFNYSEAASGGSITERHILYALAVKLTEYFGRGTALVDGLRGKFALNIPSGVEKNLTDADNPHYLYDLLGFLKSCFQPRFFIQPNTDECINVKKAVDFACSVGAIPAYAYLGDVDESPTGDKAAEKFEDDFLDELMVELKKMGFLAVTFMPPRNSLEQLQRVMNLCEEHGFMQISGVDINSSRQSFSCPEVLLPEFKHLNKSTWALIAHEKIENELPGAGLFSRASIAPDGLDLKGRIDYFAGLGVDLDLHRLNVAEVISQGEDE
ncbi:MAG: PHP domain-containing protein [Spirochaetales bacterium]|uniref:PHP domain-containing protein n=1 Tax=Candidatus Thalassospirochaeta sargassi TaxID=3119039 RepID=A0AAJ1IE62_9SPIO|nr:PHP domain-containing protein [Spirochaetales bacterium]